MFCIFFFQASILLSSVRISYKQKCTDVAEMAYFSTRTTLLTLHFMKMGYKWLYHQGQMFPSKGKKNILYSCLTLVFIVAELVLQVYHCELTHFKDFLNTVDMNSLKLKLMNLTQFFQSKSSFFVALSQNWGWRGDISFCLSLHVQLSSFASGFIWIKNAFIVCCNLLGIVRFLVKKII